MSESYHIEDELQQKAYDSKLMKRLLGFVYPYKSLMIIATSLLILSTLVASMTPLLNMYAIDHFLNNDERISLEVKVRSGQEQTALLDKMAIQDQSGLTRLICVMAALIITQGILRYLQMLIVTFVGQKTMYTMRVEIFRQLQKLSLRYLDKNPIGRLMTRVTTDVEHIQESIVTGLVEVVSELMTIVIVLLFMLILNWRLTLIALSTLPFLFVFSFIFRKAARRSYLEIRKRIARVNSYMQEQISGMRVVQVFSHEDASYNEFDRLNFEHRDEWLVQVKNYARYFPTVEFLGYLSVALIFLFGGRQILAGSQLNLVGIDRLAAILPDSLKTAKSLFSSMANFSNVASIGMLMAYVQWLQYLLDPILHLADKYNLLQAAMASSERIFELLDTPEEIENRSDAIECEHIEGKIEFKNVWFTYDSDEKGNDVIEQEQCVLKDISFSVNPGESVAVVGHTGAGKTTLTSLLSRFYDVQMGSITIDGIDVCDYEKTSLRKNIGMVLQDVFLFSGSVDHNIRLGNEDLSDEHVMACAKYVNASGFIEALPGKYEYDIGERGCNLSTGQRQLLAFARTLAHDPKVLVLDEATSSIDSETEALIQDAIAKLMKGRTSIVIAHRLSTVRHADRIIVLHHGEIREEGTHQELLAKRGLYYRLYQLQYKDQA